MEQIDKNSLLITTSIRKPKENATIPDLLVMQAGIVHPIPYHFTPFYIYKFIYTRSKLDIKSFGLYA
jgi:hypothetical protein